MSEIICNSKIEYLTNNREETFNAGFNFADKVLPGTVVALYGDLGTGKTVFTQGICKGLGISSYVTSPSFTIVQEYKGDIDVYHFDFYRLRTLYEAVDIGFEHYLEREAAVIIEWPQIIEQILPEDSIKVRLAYVYKNGAFMENLRKIQIELCKIKVG